MSDAKYYETHRTFWGGKRQAEVQRLGKDIPKTGAVTDPKRPALEDWRVLQNSYYRYYNDGKAWKPELRNMARRYRVAIVGEDPGEALERLADEVFEAALLEEAMT